MFKSPMYYLGNKYNVLEQMLKLFPKDINNFYDVFCGGLDVSLNIKANNIYSNDKHEDLIWLYQEISKYDSNTLGDELLDLDRKIFPMNEYNGKALRSYYNKKDMDIWKELIKAKREIYYKIRDDFNKGNHNFINLMLLILNSVGVIEYRVVNRHCTYTCGNLRLNREMAKNINNFSKKLKGIKLTNNDFRYLYSVGFNKDDFVYLDPPYLGTSQYKTKWNEKDEVELYKLLDYLNEKGVKFALSNFKDGENHNNEYLRKWCGKYKMHELKDKHFHLEGISKRGTRQEILITNY